jgi:hypothetical protein
MSPGAFAVGVTFEINEKIPPVAGVIGSQFVPFENSNAPVLSL